MKEQGAERFWSLCFATFEPIRKLASILLIIVGIVLVIISILGLVKAFDVFTTMGTGTESIVYTLGSIIFPLLLTVFGRWLFRKGKELGRTPANEKRP